MQCLLHDSTLELFLGVKVVPTKHLVASFFIGLTLGVAAYRYLVHIAVVLCPDSNPIDMRTNDAVLELFVLTCMAKHQRHFIHGRHGPCLSLVFFNFRQDFLQYMVTI